MLNVKIKRLVPEAIVPKYAKPGDAEWTSALLVKTKLISM